MLGVSGRAFTLIELIPVLALLVIITSITVPRMSGSVRGRALDSESRRMLALMHEAQSRAVSEGMPMMLWIDGANGEYGVEAETSGRTGDPNAEELTLDGTLKMAALNTSTRAQTTRHMPAIKLTDGTVDEGSFQNRAVGGWGWFWPLAGRGCPIARVMKLLTAPTKKRHARRGASAGFTLAEVLAALMFLARDSNGGGSAAHREPGGGSGRTQERGGARGRTGFEREHRHDELDGQPERRYSDGKASWISAGRCRARFVAESTAPRPGRKWSC